MVAAEDRDNMKAGNAKRARGLSRGLRNCHPSRKPAFAAAGASESCPSSSPSAGINCRHASPPGVEVGVAPIVPWHRRDRSSECGRRRQCADCTGRPTARGIDRCHDNRGAGCHPTGKSQIYFIILLMLSGFGASAAVVARLLSRFFLTLKSDLSHQNRVAAFRLNGCFLDVSSLNLAVLRHRLFFVRAPWPIAGDRHLLNRIGIEGGSWRDSLTDW